MPKNFKHGLKGTPEYNTWCAMKQRCNYPKNNRYNRYGGRGIKVCYDWNNSFLAFLKDMGSKPTPKHSLDRIDNNGNYEPSNCRWATVKEQTLNRPDVNKIEYDGRVLTIKEWSKQLNISYNTLRMRLLAYHWPIDKALKSQVRGWSPHNPKVKE